MASSMRLVYGLAIFLGAYLVFQVQPLIAKSILPWFGGSPSVWTTAMLFFQATLLVGYTYAHVVGSMRSIRAQQSIHLILLVAAVVVLPIAPSEALKPTGSEDPLLRILLILAVSVGLPYLVLSTSGPLLQRWYVVAAGPGSPYRYFALSNAGSLLGLVAYPFLVEPTLGQEHQAALWSLLFTVQAILFGFIALRLPTRRLSDDDGRAALAAIPPPTLGDRILWIALPTVASLLLLAFTNQMCQDVASIPFLWVVPLTLYLLSFILSFADQRWYHRGLFAVLLILAMEGVWVVLMHGVFLELWQQVAILCAALFVICMVCHGELHLRRPHPERLTSFYLSVAFGGALGGVLAAVVAPVLFTGYLELHFGLIAAAVLAVIAYTRSDPDTRKRFPRWAHVGAAVALVALAGAIGREAWLDGRVHLATTRNFHGVLRIEEANLNSAADATRVFTHGRIEHGFQFLQPERRTWPTAYFTHETGIGIVLDGTASPRRVGVVGLGAGTLAAYGRPGDQFTFFELNPEVVDYAEDWFTFLSDSEADVTLRVGDGRLLLEQVPEDAFDILVLDAFSSDAIPVHLLTREAFAVYDRVLAADGILAVNGTNRHVDIEPVVARLAVGMEGSPEPLRLKSEPNSRIGGHSCRWIIASRHRGAIADLVAGGATFIPDPADGPLWTDNRSNLLQILKWTAES